MSWSLNLPGLVQLLRMPGLNLMSHNRFVFVTAFALLILAAAGLDALWQGNISRRWWFLAPMALLVGLAAWCSYRAAALPEPIATELAATVRQGKVVSRICDMADVLEVQSSFRRYHAAAAGLAAVGVAGWCCLWFRARIGRGAFALLAALLIAELLWFDHGHVTQCDPALYYPRVPVLEQLAAAPPGRIIAFNCLPANLAQTHGLDDVRGYDGVDPAQWVDLLKTTANPNSNMPRYSLIQWLTPEGKIFPPGRVGLSPILSMINVRYVVFRGKPLPGFDPPFQGVDYYALENPKALPRVFVPQRVETVEDYQERLRRLSAATFDPRQIAYVESPVDLPALCQGSASISKESPQRVTVAADMTTPGLLVLADRWDPGWKAYLDGRQAPILPTNHALRGVVVPEGRHVLDFRFEPSPLAWGLVASGIALAAWLAWTAAVAWRSPGPDADRG
jgi:hypothetical protein